MRFYARLSMDSIVQPVVKLQRMEDVIPCPGCPRMYSSEDDCAEHLLSSCIRFRSDDDHDSRRYFSLWILDYFKTYSYDDEISSDAVKINGVLNNGSIGLSLKATVKVNLPELPNTLCCPICEKYFQDAPSCADHMFRECLFTENEDISAVKNWVFEYFSLKTEKSLAVLCNFFAQNPSSKLFCKYCKTEARDKESLKEHFPCSHRRKYENRDETVCAVCNFSVVHERLMAHMLSKHIRCGCGFRLKSDNADFIDLRYHMKGCDSNIQKKIKCPLCYGYMSVDVESDLVYHLRNCKKQSAYQPFDYSSLYGKCDICLNQILLCDVDAHLMKHLKQGDPPSRRPKRVRISVNDLNNFAPVGPGQARNSTHLCGCESNLS